jgi:serine/threonine protein kinase
MYDLDLFQYIKHTHIEIYLSNKDQIEKSILDLIDKMLYLGVVCMDIKPANFLINNVNDIRLTDFGIDWCCNSKIEPICNRFESNKEFLETDNYMDYMKYILIFGFSSTTKLTTNRNIFMKEMNELKSILNENSFKYFLNSICTRDSYSCYDLPPFFYIYNNYLTNKDNRDEIIKNINPQEQIYLNNLYNLNKPLYILTAYFYSPYFND